MRKILVLLSAALLLAACSTPKYTYHFDHYNYNSGKRGVTPKVTVESLAQEPSLILDESTLVASSNEETVYIPEAKPAMTRQEAIAKYNSLTKEEKKEVKREIKKYVKETKEIKESQGAKALSGDLKWAAIFGIVGIVLLLVLGDLFWLGTIAILVGLFFLVRYLINH
jgi:hypothetical protein